jgi:peptidoglycan/xylan/chitin deacetylase (PgdA/CDA1 family)
MAGRFKVAVLCAFKIGGLFWLTRYVTRRRLRILCYHGISVGDQHCYEPLLFMRLETFKRRVKVLMDQGWRIVSLDTAVRELREHRVVDNTLVVTIDDGWVSTFTEAAPVLAQFGLPSTLYVTSYYAERDADVFNVVVFYMLWKTKLDRVSLQTGYADIDDRYQLRGNTLAVGTRWIEFANATLTWQQRQALLIELAHALQLDAAEVLAGDRFRIARPNQIRTVLGAGMDIQLHTHRHKLPDSSYEAMEREVIQNKALLEHWTGRTCMHFCYPSGAYTIQQSEWLERMGLASSTTCDPGSNPVGTHPQRLRRILDRDNWSDLEFEAALFGVTDLLAPFGRSQHPYE